MKAHILYVEDNQIIQFNTKMMLEMNGYDATTADNGAEGLKILKSMKKQPDLIISDILMPEMNGYTFYEEVSKNPSWNSIPFIFISAKSSPEDVRFGKKLGVDDYITKPFEEEDLMAIIEGKLKKSRENAKNRSEFEEEMKKLRPQPTIVTSSRSKDLLVFIIDWDDVIGPYLQDHFPSDDKVIKSMEKIGLQLYNTSVSIYGHQDYSKTSNILLNMHNFDIDAVVHFASKSSPEFRGGQRLVMVVACASQIYYLESLRIQEILQRFTQKYILKEKMDIQKYWNQISEIIHL